VKRWPEVRAGLIALAIFFGLVEGCPLPPPEHTPAWERGFVEPIRAVQQAVLTPVAWIRPTLRVAQRWALYQAPSPNRYRLWIEGQDMYARWHLLFRAGDSEHQEDAALLDFYRMRGTWDPSDKPPGQYAAFAGWVTARVLERHPEYVGARVRLEKVLLTDEGVTPLGQFIGQHMRQR
jgi:hypothetical protein